MCNSPNVSKTKPLSVRPNFIPQRVHMNVVQLEATTSRKFTPSSRRPRLREQQIRSIMPQTTIVTCKFRQKAKPSRSQLENGQVTYQVLMNIQVGR